jgi:hypothetical protein
MFDMNDAIAIASNRMNSINIDVCRIGINNTVESQAATAL